jgi:hypothetical protein
VQALAGTDPPIELGTLQPGRSWGELGVPAASVAGRTIRLVLDPQMAFNQGIDLAGVGRVVQVAPRFTLAQGVARRLRTGPTGTALVGQPGPLQLIGTAMSLPPDTRTVSVWARAVGGAAPVVTLAAGARTIGSLNAGPMWQVLRVPVPDLAGRRVRLSVASPDATGLEVTWLGTVQRAPGLRIGTVVRTKRQLRLAVVGSPALTGQRVSLERQTPAGWQRFASVLLPLGGRGVATIPVPATRTALRAVYDGGEAVSSGGSAPRWVPGRAKGQAIPAS